MLLLTPVQLGPPCRRPILFATPLYQSRTWCTQRDARARNWRRTRTNPKESLRRAGRITLPRDRRHASMKREQAQYPLGTRESGRVRSGNESFENMHTRIALERVPGRWGFSLHFGSPQCCLLSYFIPLTIPHEAPDSRSFLSDFAADESASPTRIDPTLAAHESCGPSDPG
jgi:hypothetical protein